MYAKPFMRIRKASLEDAQRIAALSGQLGYPTRTEAARSRLVDLARDAYHAIFVAESESGVAIGWVHVFKTERVLCEPFAEIGGLIVDEDHRCKGVGLALLDRSEAWARQTGCSAVVVRSNVIRARAPGFYHGAGYALSKKQNVFQKSL